MASGAQIKALLKSHADGDDSQFYAVALQVAAAEARKGHADLAKELRDMVENSRKREARHEVRENVLHIAQPDSELSDLLTMTEPKTRLSELVLDEAVLARIHRILSEQHHLDRLKSHALRPRQSLLLTGPPGCGKTLTASPISGGMFFFSFFFFFSRRSLRHLASGLSRNCRTWILSITLHSP